MNTVDTGISYVEWKVRALILTRRKNCELRTGCYSIKIEKSKGFKNQEEKGFLIKNYFALQYAHCAVSIPVTGSLGGLLFDIFTHCNHPKAT